MAEDYTSIKKFLDQHDATLVAVSKTKSPEEVMLVYNRGQIVFGENNVQELLPKYEQLPKDIEWHLIGHLQSNKVKFIAPFISLIHSVDSFKLLNEINKQAKKNNRIIPVLLQIYIASEETKFGLGFAEAKEILQSNKLLSFENVLIKGLMGMATFTDDESQIRREFKSLKNFFDELRNKISSNVKFEILSMGMSSDYKIAVEEGSNLVRIGSLIFGARKNA